MSSGEAEWVTAMMRRHVTRPLTVTATAPSSPRISAARYRGKGRTVRVAIMTPAYSVGMEEEPRNAGSDLARRAADWLNDRDFVEREGEKMVTPDFVRYDHRRVTPQPPVGAQEWVAGLFELEKLTGDWPVYELTETLAVRGDRTSATHWVLHFGEFAEMEFIAVGLSDEQTDRMAELHFYDPEDIDAAIAELDRLHAETEAGNL